MSTARLSFAQEHQYVMEQVHPGLRNMSIYRAQEITGKLNAKALANAVNTVFLRHQALRATIDLCGDDVVQKAEAKTSKIAVLSCIAPRYNNEEELDIYLRRNMLIELTSIWDYENEPPFRAKLIRTRTDHHIFWICARHFMVDYPSLLRVEKEIWVHYANYLTGSEVTENQDRLDFFEAVNIQRTKVSGHERNNNLHYWLSRLPSELWRFEPRPGGSSSPPAADVSCAPLIITGTQLETLRRYARRAGATAFQVALAGISEVLNRLMDTEQLVVLVVMDSRPTRCKSVVGMFAQAHPIVLRLDPQGGRLGPIQQAKREILNGMRHLHIDSNKMLDIRRSMPDVFQRADQSCITITYLKGAGPLNRGASVEISTACEGLAIRQFGVPTKMGQPNGMMITVTEDTANFGIYIRIAASAMSAAAARRLETSLRDFIKPSDANANLEAEFSL